MSSGFFVLPLIPMFGLSVTSALGFKARVDPSLRCFLACMQWIPKTPLWSDTDLLTTSFM